MSDERGEIKTQIARMQAEIEKLGVASVNENNKLRDFLKDEVTKIDSEIEKIEAKKAKLEADKDEFQELLTNLESSDKSQKSKEADQENNK